MCVVDNPALYYHSHAMNDFNIDSTLKQAFFRFNIKNEINCDRSTFSIQVFQQCDVLGSYRYRDQSRVFEPDQFNIVLLNESSGEFVTACFGSSFLFSLHVEDVVLPPGDYIVMIDPIWNEKSERNPLNKQVLIDIYAPQQLNLQQVQNYEGLEIFANCIRHAAITLSKEEQQVRYLEDRPDY